MTASQKASALLGTVVADCFRLVREIAGGGMGFVFEAEHLSLGRPFALKVLQLGHWNEELVRRFEREARALARVRSPRVAQVTDYGIDPQVGPFYVMELVEGETLHDRLKREGVLAPGDAVPIATALCAAMADVHEVGIVHRDLKPGNIGLPIAGPVAVKLLDFGLAASIDDTFLTRITESHQVLGSLPYIAPEQLGGARPQASQDLWALGIVLFEMVRGRLPFDAPSTAALMHSILSAPVPPLDDVPLPLANVIRRLLIKEPTQRLQSARDAADELARIDPRLLPQQSTLPGHGGPNRTIPSGKMGDVRPEDLVGATIVSGVLPVSSAHATPDALAMPRTKEGPASIPRTQHSSPAVMIPRTTESPSSQNIPRTSASPSIPPTSHAYPSQPAPPMHNVQPGRSIAPRRTHWAIWLFVGLVLGALTAVGIVWLLEAVPSDAPAPIPGDPVAPDPGPQTPPSAESVPPEGTRVPESPSDSTPDTPQAPPSVMREGDSADRPRTVMSMRTRPRQPPSADAEMQPVAAMMEASPWTGDIIETPE